MGGHSGSESEWLLALLPATIGVVAVVVEEGVIEVLAYRCVEIGVRIMMVPFWEVLQVTTFSSLAIGVDVASGR